MVERARITMDAIMRPPRRDKWDQYRKGHPNSYPAGSMTKVYKCRRKIQMSPGVQSRDDTPGGSDEVEPRI
jgi:hypothetical protein